MARNVFMAFLGTGLYQKCTYYNSDKDFMPTRFIQKATLEAIGATGWTEDDAVLIFVTQKAAELNWDKSISSRKDKDNNIVEYEGLEKELEEMDIKAGISAVPVKDGKDETEMWSIFQTVFSQLKKGDNLYIDLTHAFRYLPMLVLVLSNYAKFLLDVSVKQMSYGNYEARDRDTNRAPIVNLMSLKYLQDWTSAASEFLKDGRSETMVKMAKPIIKQEKKRAFLSGAPTEGADNIIKFVQSLSDFTRERQNCRGDQIEDGDTLQAIETCIQRFKEDKTTEAAPLVPLLEHVAERLRNRDSKLMRLLDAVDWCCEMRLYQQAATMLQEGVVSFFCRRNGMEEDMLMPDKRRLVNYAFDINLRHKPQYLWQVSEEDFPVLKRLVDDRLIKQLAEPFAKLKTLRNTFDHAGFQLQSSRSHVDNIQTWSKIFREALCGASI